jgi:hypothetical protein
VAALGLDPEGIDPTLVGDRIRALKTEREEVEAKLAQLDHARTDSDAIDPDEAAEILASMPDLSAALAEADPETRYALYESFRLRVEIDRNAGQIRLKALVSSAFSEIKGLSELSGSAPKAIARERFGPNSDLIVPIRWAADFAPQAGLRSSE